MLEGMGHPVTRDSLERIGINYDFGGKTFYIYLFYRKNSKKSTTDAPSVKKTLRPKNRQMIAIGILRWFFDYQREEIRTVLLSRGIHISIK